MSKNLRVFLLSLLVVIFAASCVFADVSLEEDSDYPYTTTTFTEGYTYTARYYLDPDGYLELGDTQVPLASCDIAWTLTSNKDTTWLNIYEASPDKQSVILEGKLPEYVTDSNAYNMVLNATVSYEYELFDNVYTISEDAEIAVDVTVEEDTTDSGKIITPVEAGSSTTGARVYISSTAPVSNTYEAHLTVEYQDTYLQAYIPADDLVLNETIFLPPWLSFDVAETVTVDGTAYATDIKLSYNKLTYEPAGTSEATINITGVDVFDYTSMGPLGDANYVIRWDVKFGNSIHIADGTVAAISLKLGETSSDTIAYTGPDPVSCDIATDSTSTLSADELGLEITSGNGVITVTVTPTDSGSYLGTLTFADSAGKTASAKLSVDVTPVIAISEDSVVVSARINSTSSKTININGADIASYDISPNVPAAFGLTVASADRTITLTIAPSAPADDYNGTLTVYDDYGNSDDVSVTLSTAITGDLTISAASTTATVAPGGTTTVNFTASNAVGAVTWLGTQTSGSGLKVTFSPTGTAAATSTTATITADSTAVPGTGTISVYASAGAQTSNTVTITVTVSEPTFTITPSQSSVTFDSPTSSAQTVTLTSTLSNTTYKATVSSSYGLSPVSGLTAAISGSTLTLTPSAAGSYTVTVTGTSGTREAETTISVVVDDDTIAVDVNDLDATTQTEIAKVKALRAGGITSATISVSSYLEALGSTPVVADSWVLYIGSEVFNVSSSSVNSTASDWYATLTDNTTSSVKVNIIAPETITSDTDIILGFNTLGTNTSGSSYEIPLATIPAGGSSSPTLRSSSSSGCSAGFGALALLFAVPMFIRRKRS